MIVQAIVASAIVTGGEPAFIGLHPGFEDPPTRNGPGDWSLFLTEALPEANCRVTFTDHRQDPIRADTIYGYSRPSDTEIRVVSSTDGEAADVDFDVVVVAAVET